MPKLFNDVRNKRTNVTSGFRVIERESLDDTLGQLGAPEFDGYCANASRDGGRTSYLDWESSVRRWLIQNHGWGGFQWFDIERDSFGPLVRGLRCVDNKGKDREFFYG